MRDLTLHGSRSPVSLKEDVGQSDGQDSISDVEKAHLERIVWRKLDRWVLPVATIFYLLSFLVSDGLAVIYEKHLNCIAFKQDRSNIANARVAGMQTSLQMTNYQVELNGLMQYN
jgi:hypothetical protein